MDSKIHWRGGSIQANTIIWQKKYAAIARITLDLYAMLFAKWIATSRARYAMHMESNQRERPGIASNLTLQD